MRVSMPCPHCQAELPVRRTWSPRQSDWRRCEHCQTLLVRVNLDRQPWTTFIALGVLLPMLAAPIVAGWLWAQGHGLAAALSLPAGVVMAYALNHGQFPYTNAYVAWRPLCAQCGYDLQAIEGPCPECGGQPMQHPDTPPAPPPEAPCDTSRQAATQTADRHKQ